MLYSRQETLEDAIVRAALKGPVSIKVLHGQVVAAHPVSLRAVYKATNSLVNAGVLIKTGGRVLTDQEWIREVKDNLASTPPALALGERIAYTFASVEHLDVFWKSAILQLEGVKEGAHVFLYNPHNFWAHVPERKKSEDAYYAHFVQAKKHAFFVIGGTTKADMDFKRMYQNDYLQIDTRPIGSLERRDHITVMGDLIVTARIAKPVAEQFDKLYESGWPARELLPDMISIYRTPQRIRLVIEHNQAKAKKLKSILSKNFFIPR